MSKVSTNKMMVGNHQSKRIDATLFNQRRAGAIAKAEWLAADKLANPEKYKRSRRGKRAYRGAGIIAAISAGLAVTGAGPLNTAIPRSTTAPSTFAAPYGQKR